VLTCRSPFGRAYDDFPNLWHRHDFQWCSMSVRVSSYQHVFRGLRLASVRVGNRLSCMRCVSCVSKLMTLCIVCVPHLLHLTHLMRLKVVACHACSMSCVFGLVAARFVPVSECVRGSCLCFVSLLFLFQKSACKLVCKRFDQSACEEREMMLSMAF
jgi:hypothetical protein